MVPMIGSICKGSIGICQLPRAWWKAVPRLVGLLDPSYPDNSDGLDTWCLQSRETRTPASFRRGRKSSTLETSSTLCRPARTPPIRVHADVKSLF